MNSYPPKPENVRAPENLSHDEIRKSLEELDGKIKILQGRAHATTVDSNHTYHQHIAALERKRSLIADKLNASANDTSNNTWTDIKSGIDSLANDIKKIWE
jgi:predicted mannosyl-3-phosphoglycerate phosphatase (HAD superfamily)